MVLSGWLGKQGGVWKDNEESGTSSNRCHYLMECVVVYLLSELATSFSKIKGQKVSHFP